MRDTIISKIDLHKLSDEKLLELYDLMLDQPRKMNPPDKFINQPLINPNNVELNTNIVEEKDEQIQSLREEFEPKGIVYYIDRKNAKQYVLRFSDESMSKYTAASFEDGNRYLINREQLDIIEKNIDAIQASKYPFELNEPYWMTSYYDVQSNLLFETFKVVKRYDDGYDIKLIAVTPSSNYTNKLCKCAYIEPRQLNIM
jgi:hypothetical protein